MGLIDCAREARDVRRKPRERVVVCVVHFSSSRERKLQSPVGRKQSRSPRVRKKI